MVDESADAVARSVLALWLSGGAIAVALAAAGFTLWQAVTAHLARVRPLRADWVFRAVEINPRLNSPASGWFLQNTGGCTATDVQLTAYLTRPTSALLREVVENAEGAIPATSTVRLAGTENRAKPGMWLAPKPDEPGKSVRADLSRDGKPIHEEAWRIWEQWGEVSWIDENGKRGKKRIALY